MQEEVEDYSQGGEQATILRACEGIKGGKFLDIGAFSAKALSNTRALYEIGWDGVLIEPSPGPLKGLIQEYGDNGRIKILACAVGVDRHMARFHVTDDAVSTAGEENFEKWKAVGGFYGSFWVPQVRIIDVMNQFGRFDFVNIDTEGTSFALLQDLLKTPMLPQCICVEHDSRAIEITSFVTERGYKVVGATGENMILSL